MSEKRSEKGKSMAVRQQGQRGSRTRHTPIVVRQSVVETVFVIGAALPPGVPLRSARERSIIGVGNTKAGKICRNVGLSAKADPSKVPSALLMGMVVT